MTFAHITRRKGAAANGRCLKCGSALLPASMKTRRTREIDLWLFVFVISRTTQEFQCAKCDHD